jgi:hypothetical protein
VVNGLAMFCTSRSPTAEVDPLRSLDSQTARTMCIKRALTLQAIGASSASVVRDRDGFIRFSWSEHPWCSCSFCLHRCQHNRSFAAVERSYERARHPLRSCSTARFYGIRAQRTYPLEPRTRPTSISSWMQRIAFLDLLAAVKSRFECLYIRCGASAPTSVISAGSGRDMELRAHVTVMAAVAITITAEVVRNDCPFRYLQSMTGSLDSRR